jgi:hypothetical protein
MNIHSASDWRLSPRHLSRLRDEPLSRREAIRRTLFGAAGLVLGQHLSLQGIAADSSSQAKAKSVIQIWMWGGPSHLDTFDPKPEAGSDYCGQFDKPIPTKTDGVRICELMPLLAKQSDQYSLIRSMTHGVNAHETASYMVQTARAQGGHDVFPCVGAVVSLFKGHNAGYQGLVPPYVVLTQPQGRFSEAGFLGSRYKPFATGGDPALNRFVVEGIVSENISDQRQKDRRGLLHSMDTFGQAMKHDTEIASAQQAEMQAYDMILGDGGKIFDLSQEKNEMRDRYGRNTFGQSCLVARRLVERGVPYVTINSQGWDTHKQNFQVMRRKLPELDKGLATLLQDLAERGLLNTTLLWCCGEFGRTPKVQWDAPWNGGRNHWGNVFSALVAGGGFKGGQVVGASDARGEEVKDRPVYPADLLASIYALLGIDSNARLPHPEGLDVRVVPASSDNIKTSGLLKELM